MNKIYQKFTKTIPEITSTRLNKKAFSTKETKKLIKSFNTDCFQKQITEKTFDFNSEEEGFFTFGGRLIKIIFPR